MLEKLNKYHEEGLVYKQVHPTLPLTIWNYSEKVQYEGLWDEITLQTRGLVTDDEGNVVARPFKKFFNLEEGKHTPTEEFEVYEKMDGSLGILFFYEGQWVVATRGSFTSDQAMKAQEMIKSKYIVESIPKGYTTLVEIIFPKNRIVVDYGDEESLVVLGMTSRMSGKEMDYESLLNVHNESGMTVVKKYDKITDYTFLKKMIADTHEGFVVRFSNGERIKIKGEEYLRLHKIMTNLSTTAVWEVLSNGGNIENLLKNVPDEFFQKIKEYERTLKYGFFQVSEHCGKSHDYFRYGKYNDKDPEPTKKEFAEHVMKNTHPPYKQVMFAMWDRKPYDHIIWKILKPKFRKL
jgi:T4 RnlA family RNA ligase